MHEHREDPIVVISNRGPAVLVWADGRWQAQPAAGGLSSTLRQVARETHLLWICCVPEPPEARSQRPALLELARSVDDRIQLLPIPVPVEVVDGYYNCVSNEVLWMLQHLLLGPGAIDAVDRGRQHAWEHGYLEANRRIADAVAASVPRARVLLVQDYHLYPLPALLRERFPATPILHFTHIPFPGPTAWRLLPASWRDAIFSGVLGADVVGVQTPRDVRAFLASAQDLFGLRTAVWEAGPVVAGTVSLPDGRSVAVRAYPASVDPGWLRAEMRSEAVGVARDRLAEHQGRRIVVRADRLDPAKNQVAGFLAFARLLERRPDLRRQIRFLCCLVVSRTGLPVYRAYRAEVLQLVDEINARFAAECDGPPIVLYLQGDQPPALAAYEQADVLLVNSFGDGMNLVVKEWAVVTRRQGVAVVSETAGIASELAGAVLPIAPLDVEGTTRALAEALDMPLAERSRRLAQIRDRLAAWTSRDWLTVQLADLERVTGRGDPVSGSEGVPEPPEAVLPMSSDSACSRWPVSAG